MCNHGDRYVLTSSFTPSKLNINNVDKLEDNNVLQFLHFDICFLNFEKTQDPVWYPKTRSF